MARVPASAWRGAAVFVRYDGPATLWARRSIMVGCNWTIWSSCGDGYVPQYFLSGSNQLEVLYVPVPASVEGPAVVAPGQSVTFAGRTVEDYPVDEPYAGYRSIWWTYIEGDTLPQPVRGGAEVGVWNCSYQLACDFAPQVSGRMRMMAFINGYEVTAYSGIVRVQESEIELTCTGDLGPNRVTRGQRINCGVTAMPSGTMTDIQWNFEESSRSDGDPASPTWAGPMVRSGTVQVSARIGSGPPQSASATIEVVDRTWPDVPKTDLRTFGVTDGDEDMPALPARITWASDLGVFRAFAEAAPGEQQWPDAIHNVVSGPNYGLDYFADLSFPVRGRIRIHDEAMSSGSGFLRAQERNSTGGGTVIGGVPWCSPRVVTSTLPGLVRAHEDRHAEVYREKYAEVVRAELAVLERMTGTYSDLADAYDSVRARAHAAATAASLDIHKLRGNPNTVTASENGRNCNLKNEDGRLLENEP